MSKQLYRVKEFAEHAGVTVRTLHHYDRLGLLKPSQRTDNGYRWYSDSDMTRLQQIVMLKFVGLNLEQIRELLRGKPAGLHETFLAQRRLLEHKRDQLDQAIRALMWAEQQTMHDEPNTAAIRRIIEVIQMANNTEWAKRYYSEEAQAKLAEKARKWSPELQAKAQADWAALISEVEAAIANGESPDGPVAQGLAERWKGLIESFTGGDSAITEGLNKLYADQANWPSSFQKPYSDAVGNFVCAAMRANGK